MDTSPGKATFFVTVLLPLPLEKEYTYRIPSELNEEIEIGKRVVVQFGRKKVYSGLIISVSTNAPADYEAKYILSILDDRPSVSETQLKFWKWISDYYMSPLGLVMNLALPGGLKLQSESKVVLNQEQVELGLPVLDPLEEIILNQLYEGKEPTIDEIAALIQKKSPHKYLKSLYDKNLIFIVENIKERYQPKLIRYIGLAPDYLNDSQLKVIFDQLEKRSPKQLQVLMHLLSEGKRDIKVPKLEFKKKNGLSDSAIKSLLDKGILEEDFVQVDRVKLDYPEELKTNTLADFQTKAVQEIKEHWSEQKPVLLQGDTSSGKTHIYIQLMEEAIERGEQSLYLLPEISLTTQLIQRIQAYFGELVMVSHSRFSENERMEIWSKIHSGEVKILIAPRSGIFMPFQNLGLIIVDEEHETSYKQFEASPSYHARDCSIVLAQMNEAKVVLGSATPAIESRYNASEGKYGLVSIEGRYSGVEMPVFEVVDMLEERRKKMNTGLFSSVLLNEIQTAISLKEQVILFQNRKGYVPVVECDVCSWAPKCVNCDITLTYYKNENKLKCHYCGYNRGPIKDCPACGNQSLILKGYGTERIEDELSAIMPNLRIQRYDQNTTRTKTAFKKIISEFEQGEIDVLIGTQMITKGLDFDHVNTVGIMDADHALNFPDFRAFERSFQLMVQVAGRAGRRSKRGKVIIQTKQAEHQVIQQTKEYNYKELYEQEIESRKAFAYPPFSRLILLTLKHKNYHVLAAGSEMLVKQLKYGLGDRVLGPEEPYVGRIRNLYLMNILIKIDHQNKNLRKHKTFIREVIRNFKTAKDYQSVKVQINVDPI